MANWGLYGTYFGGKINWFRPKDNVKRGAPDLENQELSWGPRNIPTQRFNLLHMGPNWFLGNWTLDLCLKWKTLNRPKEMNVASTKILLQFCSSNLPICLIYFHLVMPRHVLNPCYAHYEHIRGITYYLTCYVKLQVQNMLYYTRLQMQKCMGVTWKNMDGANGQIGKTNHRSIFVLTTFISFGLFNIFRLKWA